MDFAIGMSIKHLTGRPHDRIHQFQRDATPLGFFAGVIGQMVKQIIRYYPKFLSPVDTDSKTTVTGQSTIDLSSVCIRHSLF
jgi:hypothetical protein